MLRQRVLCELSSGLLVRQGSRGSSSTYRSSISLCLFSTKLTVRGTFNPRSPVFSYQAKVLSTSARKLDTPCTLSHKRSRIARTLYKTAAFTGFTGLTITGLVVAFFAYDASTYKYEVDSYDVAVSELAMNPRRGGPKNLPIAEILVPASILFCKICKSIFDLL